MELFGIMIAALLGFFLAPLYCLLFEKIMTRLYMISSIILEVSGIIIILFIAEICLVVVFGPQGARHIVGKWFFTIHEFLTLSIAPASGAFLLLIKENTKFLKWYFVAPLCWLIGVSAILYQYFIAESLYGIDLGTGPYTWPW